MAIIFLILGIIVAVDLFVSYRDRTLRGPDPHESEEDRWCEVTRDDMRGDDPVTGKPIGSGNHDHH